MIVMDKLADLAIKKAKAGEKGNQITHDRLKFGEIEIEDNLLNKLKEVVN